MFWLFEVNSYGLARHDNTLFPNVFFSRAVRARSETYTEKSRARFDDLCARYGV